MKKALGRALFLVLVILFPGSTMAGVDVGVSISLPPLIVFSTPPEVVVIPETYVYVVPDSDADIYFYNGWWWRPWEGRWYRSRHYDSGWAYYRRAPSFYAGIPPGWRNDYRDHRWGGQPWNYQRIPHQQLQRNWNTWKNTRHWEKEQTWGVQGLKPRTRSEQPSKKVQQRSQAKSPPREEAKPQPSRPPSREAQPPPSRPQSRETSIPQQSRPQTGEVQSQHSRPQHREAPQQAKPRQGRPERGDEEKQDRKPDGK
jgi:hypothetical protein